MVVPNLGYSEVAWHLNRSAQVTRTREDEPRVEGLLDRSIQCLHPEFSIAGNDHTMGGPKTWVGYSL
jgi:hypothetical protein